MGSTELDMSLNYFREQKTYEGILGKAQDIKNLLFLKPGDYPSIPEMGINISAIRFKDIDVLLAGDLKDIIKTQITAYIDNVPLEDVNLYLAKVNNIDVLFIDITLVSEPETITIAIAQKNNQIINFDLNLTENKVGRT